MKFSSLIAFALLNSVFCSRPTEEEEVPTILESEVATEFLIPDPASEGLPLALPLLEISSAANFIPSNQAYAVAIPMDDRVSEPYFDIPHDDSSIGDEMEESSDPDIEESSNNEMEESSNNEMEESSDNDMQEASDPESDPNSPSAQPPLVPRRQPRTEVIASARNSRSRHRPIRRRLRSRPEKPARRFPRRLGRAGSRNSVNQSL